jgi:hypothetical protein
MPFHGADETANKAFVNMSYGTFTEPSQLTELIMV